jgi:hypothetical protein
MKDTCLVCGKKYDPKKDGLINMNMDKDERETLYTILVEEKKKLMELKANKEKKNEIIIKENNNNENNNIIIKEKDSINNNIAINITLNDKILLNNTGNKVINLLSRKRDDKTSLEKELKIK